MSRAESSRRLASFKALGGAAITDELISYMSTPSRASFLESSFFADSVDQARRKLDETESLLDLIARRPDFEVAPFSSCSRELAEAAKGATLTGETLRIISTWLRSISSIERIYRAEGIMADSDHPLNIDCEIPLGLAELIEDTIEVDGSVRDDATPRIARASALARELSDRLAREAQRELEELSNRDALQDRYITIRADRFVLPIRATSASAIDGIIHDRSSSGQTYFVEPIGMARLNNQLKEAKLELDHARAEFLKEMTQTVLAERVELERIYEILKRIDILFARARLSRRWRGSRLEFGDRIKLLNVANPLLELNSARSIRNDIVLDPSIKTAIFSGPNGGGKTVTMMTIALCGHLSTMGIFVPADMGSSMPFYASIEVDIGDGQSIDSGLSTFEAKLVAIKGVFERARSGSMAVFDEFMSATDPRDGAALGMALLENLSERGVFVMASTHSSEVKALALASAGMMNFSLERDTNSFEPTYKVLPGAPGSSEPLELARRVGLPDALIESARLKLDGSDQRLESALRAARDRAQDLERDKSAVSRRLKEAIRAEDEAKRALIAAREREQEIARSSARRIAEQTQRARSELDALLKAARDRRADLAQMRAISRRIEDIDRSLDRDLAPVERIARGDLTPGDEIYLLQTRSRATLISIAPDRSSVEVSVGSMRARAPIESVVGIGRGSAKRPKESARSFDASAELSATEKIDIRGYRADDAIDAIERAFDRAIRAGLESVTLIHGEGSGALRAATRAYLAESIYVRDYEAARTEDQRDVATVARLKLQRPPKR